MSQSTWELFCICYDYLHRTTVKSLKVMILGKSLILNISGGSVYLMFFAQREESREMNIL